MSKPVIRLFVNDPMGMRWTKNTEAASLAERELGASVVIIKKTSPEYQSIKNPPPCPSVEVNGKLVVENGTATFEELKSFLGK